MDGLIRINQKIVSEEDPEVFDYLAQFTERSRAYQARKLMLLGLLQLNRIGSNDLNIEPARDEMDSGKEKAPVEAGAAGADETDLIVGAGVADLFSMS